ncbi:MAG: hypothetical protein ABH864_07400 [archaeon]
MNKKAALGAQTMIFIFLINLFIIGAGIAFGVSSFFASEYDARDVDAYLLATHIRNCITEGKIELEDEQQFASEFFEKCRINEEAINSSFFIYIEFKNGNFTASGPGDRTQCALSEKNDAFPKCEIARIEEKGVFIQAGSNQKARKVRSA